MPNHRGTFAPRAIAAIVTFMFGTTASFAIMPASGPTIAWEKRWAEAMATARKEGKPVLLDFWATWCGPCREMEAKLWSRPDVVALTSKFVCVRVDFDNSPEIVQRYRAEGLPTVVLSDPWGTEIARRTGFKGVDEHLSLLRAMPADFSEVGPWQERLAVNRRDSEALREVGLAYHRMKLFQVSTEFLEKALATSEVRSTPELLGQVLTVVGWNGLKLENFKAARKSFERCLKEAPEHRARDVTMYGLIAVDLVEGKRQQAEALFQRLDSCCHDSPLTAKARSELGAVVSQSQ